MLDYIEIKTSKANDFKLSGLDGIMLLCSKGLAVYQNAVVQDMFDLFKGAFWFVTKEDYKSLYCNYDGDLCMFRGLKSGFDEKIIEKALKDKDAETILRETISLGEGALLICPH